MHHAATTARRRPVLLGLTVLATAALAAAAVASIGPAPAGAAAQQAPQNTADPSISGTPHVGATLTANAGTWTSDSPVVFTYQWRRCDANGNACVDVPGATESTYRVQAGDAGNTLRVRVTASNASGSNAEDSAPTAVVTQPPTDAVPIGAVSLPNRLVIDDVEFSPNPVRSRNATIDVRVHVREVQTNRPVRGALVFLRSTPVVTTTPAEQATGSDGWATLTTAPESDFPRLDPSYSVQFFVRARKPGEDPLAGVSIRRLVQVGLGR